MKTSRLSPKSLVRQSLVQFRHPPAKKMEAGCPVANLGKKSPVIKNKTQVMNFSIEYNGFQEISPDGPTIAPGWSPMIKYPPVVC
jgi:hypothetical protein